MNKFDKYFKSQKHSIIDDLINTYVDYNHKYLITNSYGILMVNNIPDTFKENVKHKDSILNIFNGWLDSEICNSTYTYKIDIETFNNNINVDTPRDKYVKINDICDMSNVDIKYALRCEYGIDYGLFKKTVDIIGCKEIYILYIYNQALCGYQPIIKVIGRDNQVGYQLPTAIY